MSSKRTVWFKRMVLAVLLLSPIAQGCGVEGSAQPTGGGCTPAGGGPGGCTPVGGGGGCGSPKARIAIEMGGEQAAPAAPAPAQTRTTAGGEKATPAGSAKEAI